MSTDSVVSIAWDISKCAAVPIQRHIGYVVSSKTNARELQAEVQKLKYCAHRIRNATIRARNNLQSIYSRVTEWQDKADKAVKEAEELLDDFGKVTKTCCSGTLPDPNYRYQFSKNAKDKIEDIRRLLRDHGEFKDMISFDNPTPEIMLREEGVFESRASLILDIMDALADDSKSVVGVYGMGGVGKSILVADVASLIRGLESFTVTTANVSQKPDIETIQGEIADALGLTEIKKKETTRGRAKLLHWRLKEEERNEKKVLIILDNLWERLDLKSVGIPCGHDNKVTGCKLLLTSRDRDVLRRGMGCDLDFPLGGLQEEEAKRLFERMVGDKIHEEEFEPLVDEALRKCAGLPLLITEMAKSFKYASLSEWNNAFKQIEMSKNEGIGKIINDMLQKSYDYLKGEEVNSLLRLCVVYDISKPKLENLVRYGLGYGLVPESPSMNEARGTLSTLIHTLQASSHMLDNEDADGFKIHDLVCGFVISVASRDHHLLVLKGNNKMAAQLSEDKLKSCTAICFSYIDMDLPEKLDCPKLLIFLLFTENKFLNIPDSYFNSMRELKVLNLTGICLTCSSSPSSFQFLDNLHTLCLDDCSLEDVAILGELKGLQILSFVNSKIRRLPNKIGELVELRLLDLNHCSRLQVIEPDVLRRLIKLEELYMENSFRQWTIVEPHTPRTNASLIDLNNMKNLYTLHISIPDLSVIPADLNLEKLGRYRLQIGDVRHPSSYKVLRTLTLKLNPQSDILWKGCIKSILGRTYDLFLEGLSLGIRSICELSPQAFESLKHLHVKNSDSVHYVLQWSFNAAFRMLKSLLLENLINLEKICSIDISSKIFCTLKIVRVINCDKMEVLFPLSLVRKLPHLQEIVVVDCKLMRVIVEAENCDEVKLCDLHVLEMRDLPNIKNFSPTRTAPSNGTLDDQVGTQVAFFNGQQVSFPSLESLKMDGLPNMKDIWSDESPLELSNLQSLHVERCKSLLKVINPRLLIKLQKLHTLKISSCGSVQEIFDLDGPRASGNVESLSRLTTFHLEGLQSLRYIWNKNPCGFVGFHNLKLFEVSGCDNLDFLFFSSMVQSLVRLRELTVRDCKKMEIIILEEEQLEVETSETLTFQNLTNLRFEGLENLTCFSSRKCSPGAWSQDPVESRCTALFNGEVAFPNLDRLDLTGLDNINMIWDDQVTTDSFPKLKSLCVAECNKLVNVVPSLILGRLSSLESLDARRCHSLEVVFELQSLNPLNGCPIAHLLKELSVSGLPKLKCVWDKEIHRQVKFHCLRVVSISRCESLTSLFLGLVIRDLVQLEELKIDGCGIVELIENASHALHWPASKALEVHGYKKVEIVALQPEIEMPLHNQPPVLMEKGTFLNRRELSINAEAIEGPSHELKILPFSGCFQNLMTLDVSHCYVLSNMFTPTIAGNLVGLTKLRLSFCKMLTEVISDEGGKEGHPVAFEKLKYMELDGLIGLRSFSSSGYTLTFPLLEHVIVTRCLNMNFFSKGRIEAPNLKGVYVSEEKCFWMGDLNTTFQNIYENMATVAGAKFMRLSEFPELIGKWHNKIISIDSSWQLEELVVNKCLSFINAIPSTLMLVLVNMRKLQVCDCDSLVEIFDLEGLEGVESIPMLPSLQHLNLVNLPKLRQLWNKDLQEVLHFNCLSELTLFNCSNLRHAFAPSMAKCFATLQSMEIKECRQMEGVITEEECQGSVVEKITFPRLSQMKLECLPNLTSFLLGKNHTLECPELIRLTIAHCPKVRSFTWQSLTEIDHVTPSLFTPQIAFPRLETLDIIGMDNIETIWDNRVATESFHYLKSLCIHECNKIVNIVASCTLGQLWSLESLEAKACGLLEVVFKFQPLDPLDGHSVTRVPLTKLQLCGLPKLKCVWDKELSPQVKFEHLHSVEISRCESLTSLFPASIARDVIQLKELDINGCGIVELIEKEGLVPRLLFPKLTSLKLEHLVELKCIHTGTHALHWPALETLEVNGCTKVEILVSQSENEMSLDKQPLFLIEKGAFPHLQELKVDLSGQMEIWHRCLHDEEFICKLRVLKLYHISKESAISICHLVHSLTNLEKLVVCNSYLEELSINAEAIEGPSNERILILPFSRYFQHLDTLEVSHCDGLSPKVTLPFSRYFQHLKALDVSNCDGSSNMFTPTIVGNLVELRKLRISNCEMLIEVISDEGSKERQEVAFKQLKYMELDRLTRLRCFSPGGHTLTFPLLEDVIVTRCPNVKFFSKGLIEAPKLERVRVSREEWFWEENLNVTIQKMFA